jgi:hypothetical protein
LRHDRPVPEYADVPAAYLAELRAICLAFPEAHEHQPWTGAMWRIRTRTFAHALTVDGPAGQTSLVTFRAEPEEVDALLRVGHPFFKAGWGFNVLGMVLTEATDWTEVQELLTDSYCLLAPKKLAAQVGRPE